MRTQLNKYYLCDLVDSDIARPKETHRRYCTWENLSRKVNAWLILQLEPAIITGLLELGRPLVQYSVHADQTMNAIATIVMGGRDAGQKGSR